MTKLGDILRVKRLEKGIPLAELAHKAGLPVQQLANIETGLLVPDTSRLDSLAKVLEVDKAELVTDEVMTEEEEAEVQPTTTVIKAFYDEIQTLKDFGDFLKFLMTKKGLTQIQLATRIGGHASEVGRSLRGLWAGSILSRASALARELDFPEDDMRQIIDNVKKGLGPAPSTAYRNTPQYEVYSKPKIWLEPERHRDSVATRNVRPEPERRQDDVATVLNTLPVNLEPIIAAIREEAQITRALMQQQHRQLMEALLSQPEALPGPGSDSTTSIAMVHDLIDLLLKKR